MPPRVIATAVLAQAWGSSQRSALELFSLGVVAYDRSLGKRTTFEPRGQGHALRCLHYGLALPDDQPFFASIERRMLGRARDYQ